MITVDNVWKVFRLYHDPKDRLKEIIFRKKYSREYEALKGVSFTVREGETLGIVGENGAGKSTLLKILTGILLPTMGKIHVDGHITGLLELGTGFNTEFTGMQNIYMNGLLIGMNRETIDKRIDSIVDFTELGEFINEPIKTYSSGMLMRLAFSIAIHAKPRAFVVDEALSVGDAYFQQKCMRKIMEFKDTGGAIIFVSHDLNAVKTLCDSAILLEKGDVLEHGKPVDVIDFYQGIILKKTHRGDIDVEVKKVDREKKERKDKDEPYKIGTNEVELVSLKILNEQGEEIPSVLSETTVRLVFEIKSRKDLSDPHYGVMIRNRLGVSIFETNTYCMRVKTPPLNAGETARVEYAFNCPLFAGDYSISIGVGNKGYDTGLLAEYLLLAHDAAILKVMVNGDAIYYNGVFNMSPKVTIHQADNRG